MNKHYISIANGLYNISSTRLKECTNLGSIKIICYMMAQIGEFLYAENAYDRDSARLYFSSNDFYKHCEILAIDSTVAHHILTRSPKLRAVPTEL